jgi:hypothetical protein
MVSNELSEDIYGVAVFYWRDCSGLEDSESKEKANKIAEILRTYLNRFVSVEARPQKILLAALMYLYGLASNNEHCYDGVRDID